jgi:hypothetical protein
VLYSYLQRLLPPSLLLLLSSSLVEMGVGTGWTVNLKPYLNSIRCGDFSKPESHFDSMAQIKNCSLSFPVEARVAPVGRHFFRAPSLSPSLLYSVALPLLPFHKAAKRFFTTRVSACVSSSFSAHQRLNIERNPNDFFFQWLVGLTDGDGCFSVSYQKRKLRDSSESFKWTLIFKISLSLYNLRALHYIKKNLGFGSIVIDVKQGMGSFWIRDRKIFNSVIFPIFDKFPLLTTKYFYYQRLRLVYSILEDSTLSLSERDRLALDCLNREPGPHFISPAWNLVHLPLVDEQSSKVVSKGWLVGFVEAEGSFYITTKVSPGSTIQGRMAHGFCISQKLDPVVLEAIRHILHIPSQVRYKPKHDYYILDTTHSRALLNVSKFFDGYLKGMKSLEFSFWKRSFKFKGNYTKLLKTQNQLRSLRQLRPSKDDLFFLDRGEFPENLGACLPLHKACLGKDKSMTSKETSQS